jgi:hypothetical protein
LGYKVFGDPTLQDISDRVGGATRLTYYVREVLCLPQIFMSA